MKQQTRQNGFTLIELLITILIAGILMAAVPLARGFMPTLHVNSAGRGLAQEMRQARALAVQRGYDVSVVIDVVQKQVRVYGDSELDGIELADLIHSHSFSYYGGGFEFRAVTDTGVDGGTISGAINLGGTNPPMVTFRANGSAHDTGVIYLAAERSSRIELGRAIEILSTGWVQTWTYDGTGSPGPWKKWL
jgi:prepilin-type N-terminal cleavage/methylation domain-containing protein